MKKRAVSGAGPSRNDSARRRTSTTSSATSRWPRAIRSSAHSLLPMPLSPRISTPRPSRSTSVPWTVVRSARWNSSRAVIFAMAVPVDVGVTSSGTPAASAGGDQLGHRTQARGRQDAGDVVLEEPGGQACVAGRACGFRGIGLRSRQTPARGPGGCIRGSPPARGRSSGRAGCEPGGPAPAPGQDLHAQVRRLRPRLEQDADGDLEGQRHGTSGLPVSGSDSSRPNSPPRRRSSTLRRVGLGVAEDEERLARWPTARCAAFSTVIGLSCARVTRTTRGPSRGAGWPSIGTAPGSPRRRVGVRAALALLPLPLHLHALALESCPPTVVSADAPRRRRSARLASDVVAAHVHGDVGLEAVLLADADDLRRHDGVAEQSLEAHQLAIDERAQSLGRCRDDGR